MRTTIHNLPFVFTGYLTKLGNNFIACSLIAVVLLITACGETSVSQQNNSASIQAQLAGDVAGTTELISLDSQSNQSNANSISSDVSADGRYVVFDSIANNLVNDDNNQSWDIFLRDRLLNQTIRISNGATAESNGDSYFPAISDDGRFIVFSSDADNLVDNDQNGVADVFIVDTANFNLQRISVSSQGVEADGQSIAPMVSSTGQYIVYQSDASNLVDGRSINGQQIYRYNRVSGTTQIVSSTQSVGSMQGAAGNGNSSHASVSADGQSVVFDSLSDNLVANDSNGVEDVFVKNMTTQDIVRISVNAVGDEADAASITPVISADGQVVSFQSAATNLVSDDSNNVRDVFVVDLNGGAIERISVSSAGAQSDAFSLGRPDISTGGEKIVFYTASALVPNKQPFVWDVFIRDRVNQTTELVSQNSLGQAGIQSSFEPAISAGGHYVVFGSEAENLVDNDSNTVWDIFLRVLIDANQLPVAVAGDDRSMYIGEQLNLDGSLSFDPDGLNGGSGPVSEYQWSISSAPTGSSAELQNPTTVNPVFIPDVEGEYGISLVVSDGQDQSVEDDLLVTVTLNMPPTANINASALSGEAPLNITFSGAGSSDPEDPLSYSWNFGDDNNSSNSSNTSTQMDTSHTYTVPGTYTVVLEVTDSFGNQDSASVIIQVQPATSAYSPSADVTRGAAPLAVQFYANSPYPPRDSIRFEWDFGDGATSTQMDPQHVYEMDGTYLATITISDGRNSVSGNITIVVETPQDVLPVMAKYVRLDSGKIGEAEGKATLTLKFGSDTQPLPSENIQIAIGSVVVFDQPFSQFHNKKPNVYRYKDHSSRLTIDFDTGVIRLRAGKLSLQALDQLEQELRLAIGGLVGTEQLNMKKFRTKCKRCRDKDSGHSHDHDDQDDEHHSDDSENHEHERDHGNHSQTKNYYGSMAIATNSRQCRCSKGKLHIESPYPNHEKSDDDDDDKSGNRGYKDRCQWVLIYKASAHKHKRGKHHKEDHSNRAHD